MLVNLSTDKPFKMFMHTVYYIGCNKKQNIKFT